jgi:signal transduction histidine kinase
MNRHQPKLGRGYESTLRKFLNHQEEAGLARAYELGRSAIAQGLGVLDMARIHQEALESLIENPAGRNGHKPFAILTRATEGRATGGPRMALGAHALWHREQPRTDAASFLRAAEAFLLEALSPFEATHRGFREMNDRLQERNRELEGEIKERKRVEAALRESETHYHRLFNEARAMQESLRDLSNEILRTQEDERKRISRELHDEVGQSLTAISVNLTTLKNHGAWNSTVGSKQLTNAQKLLQETMLTVHRFARDLRPAMLEELGLLPALRSYLKGFSSRTGLRGKLEADPIAERLPSETKMVLYRIVQECLTNVSKHARATQVDITLNKFKTGIRMEIHDDGRSFKHRPLEKGQSSEHTGLLGMQERVRLISGQLTVEAKPGKSTTIRMLIPLASEQV